MPLTEPVPGVKPDCSEYQRWLAAPPIICPFNAYVYQATNNECCWGLMSTSKPWPLVAGSYHAPDNRYDGGDCPPPAVVRFRDEISKADALLFVTPEHNRSIPALLKNAIDWGSRPYGTSVWTGKPAATTGTSGGAISTAVAQQHLRQILGNFVGMHVMGGEAYVSFKPELMAT